MAARFDRRGFRTWRIVSAAVAMALLSGCDVATPSTSPDVSTQPSPSSVATPSAPAATLTPTPAATANISGWESAGMLTGVYGEPVLLGLRGGGAVLLGARSELDNDHLAAEVWDPTAGAWRRGAATDWYWTAHAAVALTDDRVLVVGGFNYDDGDHSSANAYLYDPAADAWLETGSMTQPRTHPGATLLPGGRVLVAGGYHRAVEMDSATNAGAVLASWVSTDRRGDDADRVRALDSGPGPIQGRALATAEIYDPATGSWSATGAMRFARTQPAMAVLADGRVLVVGSADDNVHIDDRAFRTAEIYDPATGRFTAADSLPDFNREAIARAGVELPEWDHSYVDGGSLVALPDGGALLVANLYAWHNMSAGVMRSFRLETGDGAWHRVGEPFAWSGQRTTGNDAECMLGAAIAALPDGSVLAAGGQVCGVWNWDEVDWMRDRVVRYDPSAREWSAFKDLPWGRSDSVAALLADGSVMLAAGEIRVGSGADARPEWARETHRFVGTD
jgi:hypothetical protein